MYICITEIDAKTKILCTIEPQRNGPTMPKIKGLKLEWVNKSSWPVELAPNGTYLRAPLYYGTCDDDADISVSGVLEVLTEEDYFQRKQAEYEARKPYASWLWDETTCEWVPPFPRPENAYINGGDTMYEWNEESKNWRATHQYNRETQEWVKL